MGDRAEPETSALDVEVLDQARGGGVQGRGQGGIHQEPSLRDPVGVFWQLDRHFVIPQLRAV